MTQWPIENVEVDQLRLDPQNVRLPVQDVDEPAIAAYLVEAEDLLGLAKEILEAGYVDNDLPIVIRDGGRLVVLEGNRRVTVLKALRDSSILGKAAERIDRLASRYPSFEPVPEVRVMVAPSHEAAQPILARLHTGVPKRGWRREQQAIFYHAQLSKTVTMDDLKAIYPNEARQIKRFIHMGEVRSLILGMAFRDKALEEWSRTKLPMTSLEYAYERPKIQGALGFSFGDDGLLTPKRVSAAQKRGWQYLLDQIKSHGLNTRSVELRATAPEHEAFVGRLTAAVAGRATDVPSPNVLTGSDPTGGSSPESSGGESGSATGRAAGNGSGTGATGTPEQGDAAAGTSGAEGGSRSRRGSTKARLDFSGFAYSGSSAGLRRRLEELSTLDLDTYPNAAYDLIRTVLECAIKDHFRSTNSPLPSGTQLASAVTELQKKYDKDRRMRQLLAAVKQSGPRVKASTYAATQEALNASNHEPDIFATKVVVHDAWEVVKPILAVIVGGPRGGTSGS